MPHWNCRFRNGSKIDDVINIIIFPMRFFLCLEVCYSQHFIRWYDFHDKSSWFSNNFIASSTKNRIDHVSILWIEVCWVYQINLKTQSIELMRVAAFSVIVLLALKHLYYIPIFIYARKLAPENVEFLGNNGKYPVNDAIGMPDRNKKNVYYN